MQTPAIRLGGLTYQALPAVGAAGGRPSRLATTAEWVIIVTWPMIRQEQIAGWIAAGERRPQHPVGTGHLTCYVGGASYGPPLKYVSNARSSRQGTRLIAETYRIGLDGPRPAR
jgi:hypothetical protein